MRFENFTADFLADPHVGDVPEADQQPDGTDNVTISEPATTPPSAPIPPTNEPSDNAGKNSYQQS